MSGGGGEQYDYELAGVELLAEEEAAEEASEAVDGVAAAAGASGVLERLESARARQRAGGARGGASGGGGGRLAAGDVGSDFVAFPSEEEEVAGGGSSAAAAQPAPAPPPPSDANTSSAKHIPPWVQPSSARRARSLRSPLLQLHLEVIDFCRFVEPTPEEASSRRAAVSRVEELVRWIWPESRLELFGSFATGLYLPSSDIDTVILDSGCTNAPDGLKALAMALSRRGLAKNVQLIAKARVPIVKFEEAQSGFQFDISFDVANGPAAAVFVREQMAGHAALRPLTLIVKAFLQQRDMNEVYSGGIGSYALLIMLIGFLRQHPKRDPPEHNLGQLLVDFFELYGRRLQQDAVGISCRPDSSVFFRKKDRNMVEPSRPFLFAIEDPHDPSNDVGRNSYNAKLVRNAFDFAYQLLTNPHRDEHGRTSLERIVRLDAALVGRARPEPGIGPILSVQELFPPERRSRGGAKGGGGGGGQGRGSAEAAERLSSDDDESEGEEGEATERRRRQRKGGGKKARPPPQLPPPPPAPAHSHKRRRERDDGLADQYEAPAPQHRRVVRYEPPPPPPQHKRARERDRY